MDGGPPSRHERRRLARDPDHHLRTAGAALAAGDATAAVAAFRAAVALRPRQARVQRGSGEALLAAGEPGPAVSALQLAARLDRGDGIAWLLLGRGLAGMGGNRAAAEAALAALDRGLALQPDTPWAWHLRGRLCRQLRRLGEAVVALERGQALEPAEPSFPAALGTVLLKAGRVDAALSAYGRALALAPGDALTRSAAMLATLHRPGVSLAQMQRAALDWRRWHGGQPTPRPQAAGDPAWRPRLGLVSGDLREHAVAQTTLARLEGSWHGASSWRSLPTRLGRMPRRSVFGRSLPAGA